MKNNQCPHFDQWFKIKDTKPMHFRVRNGGDFILDLNYLSGYLHEAGCHFKDISFKNNKLKIPFNRIRWELFDNNLDDLVEIESILSFSNVRDYFLIFFDHRKFPHIRNGSNPSPEIRHIFYDPDNQHIILSGSGIKIIVEMLEDERPLVLLKDKNIST